MKKIYSILILVILLSSCKKENIVDTKVNNNILIAGLTLRNEQGLLISNDSTDWKTNDNWTSKESNLFPANNQLNCMSLFKNKIIAYPNPCSLKFNLSIDKLPTTIVQINLVDKNLNSFFLFTLVDKDNIIYPKYFGIKDTVRLYYKFIENNCEFRGHGDILIE